MDLLYYKCIIIFFSYSKPRAASTLDAIHDIIYLHNSMQHSGWWGGGGGAGGGETGVIEVQKQNEPLICCILVWIVLVDLSSSALQSHVGCFAEFFSIKLCFFPYLSV